MVSACVFCGEPIEPGQAKVGRPPMAAHATCADEALADDAHWDAIAEHEGSLHETTDDANAPRARRLGCLTLIIGIGAAIAIERVGRGRN